MAGSSCCTWRKVAGFTKWSSWVLTFLAIIAIVVIVTQHQVFHQVFGDNAQIPEVIKDVSIGIMSTTTVGMLSGFWHQHAKRNENRKAVDQSDDGYKPLSDNDTITTKVWGKSRFWSLRYFLGCAGIIAAAVMLAFFMPDFITYAAKSYQVTMPLLFILTAGVGGFLVLSTIPFNSIKQVTVTEEAEENYLVDTPISALDETGTGKSVTPLTTEEKQPESVDNSAANPDLQSPPSTNQSTPPKSDQPTTEDAPQKDAAEDDVSRPKTPSVSAEKKLDLLVVVAEGSDLEPAVDAAPSPATSAVPLMDDDDSSDSVSKKLLSLAASVSEEPARTRRQSVWEADRPAVRPNMKQFHSNPGPRGLKKNVRWAKKEGVSAAQATPRKGSDAPLQSQVTAEPSVKTSPEEIQSGSVHVGAAVPQTENGNRARAGSVVDGDTINIQGDHYWKGHQGTIVGEKIVKREGVVDTAPVYMVEFYDGGKKILTPVGQNLMAKVQKDDNDTKRRLLTILNKL